MIDAQDGFRAQTDEMRSSARTIEDAGAHVRALDRSPRLSGGMDETRLQQAIDVALEHVSRSLAHQVAQMGTVASAVVHSADMYDDGDRAFTASLTPRS